jgi:uncharacterized protein (DUF2267 family)
MDEKTFIRDVARRVACDEGRAEALVFAAFQELRERLTPKEASHVAAQMPHALKKLWTSYEKVDWPVIRRIHAEEFIGEVRKIAALPDEAEARPAVIAVFGELQKMLVSPHGVEGEAWDVMAQLPKHLKKCGLRRRGKGPNDNHCISAEAAEPVTQVPIDYSWYV